ncbi:MAG: DUF1549 domain-containing protein [Chitinophagaceae bacterium]|nr:DUF1549 domain-containing protein [Chitinophagaceae bacterium]
MRNTIPEIRDQKWLKSRYAKIPGILLLLTVIACPAIANEAGTAAEAPFWLWTLLGRLHPLVVHFPVGLLVIAWLLELLVWNRKSNDFAPAIKVIMVVGCITSVLAVVFGLLLINSEDYGGEILWIHQWSGIVTMILAAVTTYAYFRGSRRLQKILLTLTVAGITIVGHYGASLTHGEDYLTSVLPSSSSYDYAANESTFILTNQTEPLNETQIQELNLQIRTIFAHSCTNCHGEAKSKGDLRLDSKEAIFKGGENGPVLVPGDPGKSDIVRRIKLPRGHKEAMPTKGKGLTPQEIAIIEYWVKQGAPWPEGPLKSIYRVAALEPRTPAIPASTADLTNPVDLFVNEYFKEHKMEWGKRVDDRTYIRRVYLDVIGLLPAADSVDAFVNNNRPDKREALVSDLLSRNSDYAQHWLTFWNDALRNDYSGTGYITKGRYDITRWLYRSLRDNKPYNTFVKELISPDEESKGFIAGIKWRGTINASQRTEMQAAQNVSQIFLGLNLKCTSCHDSFTSDWKLDDAYGFANIFAESPLEINRCDKPTGRMAPTRMLYKQLGEVDSNAIPREKLQQLADLLIQPKNGRLYRTQVNRVWAQLMGRGIVEPVDEMDRAPWSQDLLDWLAVDFVETGYDLKKLIFKILTSKTYQLPSVGIKEAELIVAPDYTFTGMLRRRLTAEQFTDAVSKAIEPVYGDSSIVYKLLPDEIRSEISFPRASLVKNDSYLTALGRPSRETVSTSRVPQANLLQALELTNGDRLNDAIKRAAVKWKNEYPDPQRMVTEIYRNTLGRVPAPEEESVALKALGKAPDEAIIQDLLWAMTLHPEFQLIY